VPANDSAVILSLDRRVVVRDVRISIGSASGLADSVVITISVSVSSARHEVW
jgi:hypothetical protein